MNIVVVIFDWLLVIALVGFIGTVAWMVTSAIAFKNSAVRNFKRLSEPPTRSVKSIIGTGKGIAQMEGVRVKHIVGMAKETATEVKSSALHVKAAADTVHFSELKTAVTNIQSVLKFLSLIAKTTQSAQSKQSAP